MQNSFKLLLKNAPLVRKLIKCLSCYNLLYYPKLQWQDLLVQMIWNLLDLIKERIG